jgi:hypothetical protein
LDGGTHVEDIGPFAQAGKTLQCPTPSQRRATARVRKFLRPCGHMAL